MRSHIIGIAGPSSSGKSELAKQLVQRLPGTSIVSLDSYYRGMEEIPLEERKKVNAAWNYLREVYGVKKPTTR